MAKWHKPAMIGALAISGAIVGYFEGTHTTAYLDPVGIPTICSGHIVGVKMGDKANPAECDAMLQTELRQSLAVVDASLAHAQPDTRRAAMTSFEYNIGKAGYLRSTTLRQINYGAIRQGCESMLMWVYAGGQKLAGLVKRREAERDLCMEGL